MVHNPILGETFTAVRGGGALLNGQPISASSEGDLASALVATEVTDAAVLTHRVRSGSGSYRRAGIWGVFGRGPVTLRVT